MSIETWHDLLSPSNSASIDFSDGGPGWKSGLRPQEVECNDDAYGLERNRPSRLRFGPLGLPENRAVAKTFFEAIGYKLGQKAAQAKSAFELMGGTEEESLRAEIRLGRDLAAALLERTSLIEDNETTRFVSEVGSWLAANVTEKKVPFSFQVTAEAAPSALGLPGGPVFVSWPLLGICQVQRDEIAFVLGHEMAHIVRRHALDRVVRDAALSLLLRQSSGRQAASAWLGQAGRQLLVRASSRDEELEADAFAVALVRTSGGEASAGERLLEKLAQMSTGQSPRDQGGYLHSHPPFRERIANLRANTSN